MLGNVTKQEPKDRTLVAARVAALREALGMTQVDVATRGKIDRTELSKVEHGANQVTSARLRKALAIGFGVDALLFGDYVEGSVGLAAVLEHARMRQAS